MVVITAKAKVRFNCFLSDSVVPLSMNMGHGTGDSDGASADESLYPTSPTVGQETLN